MNLKSAALLLCTLALAAPAYGEKALDERLGAALDRSLASCAFQLDVSGALKRLTDEESFRKDVKENLRLTNSPQQVAVLALPMASLGSGAGLFAAAQVTKFFKNADLAFNSAILGAASLVAASSFAPMANTEMDEWKWDINKKSLDASALKAAKSVSAVLKLDAVRENALSSAIQKAVIEELEAKRGPRARENAANVDLLKVLKTARYAGKPLLSADESSALERIEAGADLPKPQKDLSDNEKTGRLLLCRAALSRGLAEAKEKQRYGVNKALEEAESTIADLKVFEKTNRGALPILAGGQATSGEGESASPGAGTSMNP